MFRDFLLHARRGAALDVLEDARLRSLRDAGLSIAVAAENRQPELAVAHAERAAKLARWAAPQIQKGRVA